MKKSQKKQKSLEERAQAYVKAEQKLAEKFGVSKFINIKFPKRFMGKPSFVAKVALSVLRRSGAEISVDLVDLNQ